MNQTSPPAHGSGYPKDRIGRLSSRSLSAQLIGLITLALFPLGLIAMYQTAQVITEAERLSQSALLGQTQRSAASQRELMQEALGAAQGLGAAYVATRRDNDLCRATMANFVDAHPQFIFAGMVEVDGWLRCASSGEETDLSEALGFVTAMANPRPRFIVAPSGAMTGQPILGVSHPIYDQQRFLGVMSISIPLQIAASLTAAPSNVAGLKLIALNEDSTLIASSQELDVAEGALPPGLTVDQLRARVDDTFVAISADGERRFYAINEMVPNRVFLVGTWPASEALANRMERQVWVALGFPVVMWIVGVLVVFLGVRHLVVRHVHQLRDAMRRFALGERLEPYLALDRAPQELAEAERAFNRMARILTDAEFQAKEDLQQKTVLLREVHHRVKNNLQMILSIMNMQARNVSSPEAKEILAQLQRRVRGLAAIHRSFYTTADMVTVDARALIERIANELLDLGAAADILTPQVEMRLDALDLYPDQAVPMSMLVSEAVTNAVKYAGMPDEDVRQQIEVSMDVSEADEVTLSVYNSRVPLPEGIASEEDDSTGLGARLMRAFVTQLDGQMDLDETPDGYRVTVTFQRQEFDTSEDRLQGDRKT